MTSLDTLDARLAALCKEYQVPPPPPSPPGQTQTQTQTQTQPSQGGATGTDPDPDSSNRAVVDLRAVSRAVERNRGRLSHSQHQAQDLVQNIKNTLKKARTAFVW